MNRERHHGFAPQLASVLAASLLSAGALAQESAIGTSAKALELSDYRHFVIYPRLEKALRAQKQNNENTALKEFRYLHQQVPDNVPLTLYLAEAYRHFGHNDQAQQLLSEQLQRHPEDKRLQRQLAAIPVMTLPVNSVEHLLAQQKSCDATPSTRCRSETGQNALRLKQLSVAQAQLNDPAFAGSKEGAALENEILQRAIYLKAWSEADHVFSQKKQRQTLSPEEENQWFDVLLAGHLDARLLALQADGTLSHPQQQLAFASTLATRGENKVLQAYLASHHPRFDDESEEKNWLFLLSRYSAHPQQALENYDAQFAANRRYVTGAAFPAALKAGDYATAQKLLNTLPADEMLAERYALSTATNNRVESLRLARQFYLRSPQNLALLDRLTWLQTQNGEAREATTLLLQRYPFAGPTQQTAKLLTRLAELLQAHPDWATPSQLTRLAQPLPDPSLRQLQSQLPGLNADCAATRRLLGDLSSAYNAESWRRLGACYQQDLPGLALLAHQQAILHEPDSWQHRAVAYQAYAVEDYATAMDAWKAVPTREMSNDDLMAAANTAQAAGDAASRDLWIDEAEKRGLDNSETWWWLHSQRYLPAEPNLALADLDRAIAIEPTARSLTARAALYRQQKQARKAVSDLRQALTLEPQNAATQAALGYALWSVRAYAQSRDALETALRASPDDPQLIRQLMYVNERLGDIPQAQLYARQIIDELDATAAVTPLTALQNQERFDVRRLHEDIGRRWTFNADASIGLRSGASSPASTATTGPAPGHSYRSYGQFEAEYRIGRNMLVNGDLLSAYSRLFADTEDSSIVMPVKNPVLGTGLRWKPLFDYTFFAAIEEQIPLDRANRRSDTMLRASASFLNNGKFSDEWHPNGNGWFAQNLYLDAAQYLRHNNQAWTADYRTSWHQKMANNQTVEPYTRVQFNGYHDEDTQANLLGGVGVRWNVWTGQTQYNAWPHKISVGVEYQRTFHSINQDSSERNNTFLTLGVHW